MKVMVSANERVALARCQPITGIRSSLFNWISGRRGKSISNYNATTFSAATILILSTVCISATAGEQVVTPSAGAGGNQQVMNDKIDGSGARNALETELNSLVKAHYDLGGNDKKIAEAIISRLLIDNLTNEQQSGSGEYDQAMASDNMNEGEAGLALSGLSGPEASRVRNYLANSLYNREAFPVMPFSEAATMKRATKLGLALKQRHMGGSGRNNLDLTYGAARRGSDALAESESGDISRFGELLSSTGTLKRPVGQFDKRPSSHRYDFGLGKRVASPTYPSRYDFGLGKRVPNYVRYDFGLGRK